MCVVQADTAEVDGQAVLQTPDYHLKNTAKVLAFADSAGDLAEQIQPLQLRLQSIFRALVMNDFRLEFLGPYLNSPLQFIVQFPQLIALLTLGLRHQADRGGDPNEQNQTTGIDA